MNNELVMKVTNAEEYIAVTFPSLGSILYNWKIAIPLRIVATSTRKPIIKAV